jgi:hypothetical protein
MFLVNVMLGKPCDYGERSDQASGHVQCRLLLQLSPNVIV